MKFGKIEGTPEEIRDFFQNNGLNIIDYLERPEPPLKPIWFIVPTILLIAALICLTLLKPVQTSLQTFVFLIGSGVGIWLAVSLQIRFKNTWVAVFVAIAIQLIMLVAIGKVTPIEMFQCLKGLKN